MSEIPKCAIDIIKRFEKLEFLAYPDPAYGWMVPTIGYGTTVYPDGVKVKRGDTITSEYAEECLLHHLEHVCSQDLERIPTWPQMNDNQRGALISFAYNLGAGFYDHRNCLSITILCDSPDLWGDKEHVRKVFGLYRKSNGVTLAGLIRRREAEAELFCKPVEGGE